MKTFKNLSTLLVLFLAVQIMQAQDLITIKHSCSFDGEETNQDFYTFNASGEANKIVNQILDAVNLPSNFVVKSADCKNALATSEGRQRYILYNTSFLEDFKKDARTRWAAYCVLAHEIGHHLSNHDFELNDNRKRKVMELEADKFAGGVMFTLGASLEEAKAGIEILQSTGESNTHPPARARAEAIANGWKNSQEKHTARNVDNIPPVGTNDAGIPNDAVRENDSSRMPPPVEKDNTDWGQKTQEPEKPVYQKETPSFTEVSDALLAQQIVGTWECAWYNEFGVYISHRVALYQDFSLLAETYMGGVLSSQVVETWTVKNGIFIDTNVNGIYSKYSLVVNNNNSFSTTFLETNGVALFPIGTTFNYSRLF